MFDNPKKELERLEQKLIAVEEPEPEPDEDFEELYELLQEKFTEDDLNLSEFGPDYPEYGDVEDADEEPEVPEDRVTGLTVLACLESMGIVAIAVWWLVHYLW